MLPVNWSDEAQLDLAEIQFYIEQFNPSAARKLREQIERGAEFLAVMPYAFRLGRIEGTREYVVHPNYIIVYRVESDCIHILRIVHAKRNFP